MGSLEHIERVTDLRTWPGDIPVRHLYTAGLAGERFLREIKDHGRFLGSRCETCAYTYVPPSISITPMRIGSCSGVASQRICDIE